MSTIQPVLNNIKSTFDNAISTATFNGNSYGNGQLAKEALIRSQIIIKFIHEYIKEEFIRVGMLPNKIFPPLGQSSPELKLTGFLKEKDQDISVIPYTSLQNRMDLNYINDNKILSTNIRSQLSSMAKNFDTLYERTFAEAFNLHMKHPEQVLGEVYLIPVHEYDDQTMKENRVTFKRLTKLEKYIRMFQAINSRNTIAHDEYKYERACLLIVDFCQSTPKLYSTVDELKQDRLISEDTTVDMDNLNIEDFAQDILNVYVSRFGVGLIN